MQVKNWMLAAATAAILASCGESGSGSTDDDSSSAINSSATTTTETRTTRRVAEVPVATRTSFEAKYPQGKTAEWQYHEPTVILPIDWEWIDWRIDTSDYLASFQADNNDYWVWYDANGDWIGTIEEVSNFNSLPPAVNKTIKAQFAGYTITSVDKENDKNRTAYEIEMENGPDKMKALIAENGQVLKKKGKEKGTEIKEKNNPKDSAN